MSLAQAFTWRSAVAWLLVRSQTAAVHADCPQASLACVASAARAEHTASTACPKPETFERLARPGAARVLLRGQGQPLPHPGQEAQGLRGADARMMRSVERAAPGARPDAVPAAAAVHGEPRAAGELPHAGAARRRQRVRVPRAELVLRRGLRAARALRRELAASTTCPARRARASPSARSPTCASTAGSASTAAAIPTRRCRVDRLDRGPGARRRTVWAYFNNDIHGHAIDDAQTLRRWSGRRAQRSEARKSRVRYLARMKCSLAPRVSAALLCRLRQRPTPVQRRRLPSQLHRAGPCRRARRDAAPVVEDSRCPMTRAACGPAGRTLSTRIYAPIRRDRAADRCGEPYGGRRHARTLVEVQPEQLAGEQIPAPTYRFGFDGSPAGSSAALQRRHARAARGLPSIRGTRRRRSRRR